MSQAREGHLQNFSLRATWHPPYQVTSFQQVQESFGSLGMYPFDIQICITSLPTFIYVGILKFVYYVGVVVKICRSQ